MKTRLMLMSLASTATLIGCGDDFRESTSLKSFQIFTPFSVVSQQGHTLKIGQDNHTPPPTNDPHDGSIGDKLGMKGDVALCAANSDLSEAQQAKVADLKRRLNGIIKHLSDSGTGSLLPGEKNTVRETPNCQTFAAEINKIGELLNIMPSSPDSPSDSGDTNATDISISGIRFADEGHGWLTLNANLTNGETARFHLGIKTKDAESVLASREKTISTALTQQSTGLRFKLIDHQDDVKTNERTETCSETRYQNICRYNPSTHQNECRNEPYTVYGERSVETTYYSDTYTYTVEFLSSDLSKVLGTANVQTDTHRTFTSHGTCYTHSNPPPFPYPQPNPYPNPYPNPGPHPGPHPGPNNPPPFPYPFPH